MEVTLPKLNDWQQDVFNDLKEDLYDYYVVKAKRQCGKSILAIYICLYFAFKDTSIATIIEPTLKQCRRVYKQILKACGGDTSPLIKSANQTLLSIEFFNGSEIVFGSAEQGDALRGATVKKSILVIDEAAFISKDIYEILYPLVDAMHCPVLLISTPLFCSGEFYEKYTQGLGSGIVKSYNWSLYDTSIYLPPEKLEYYRQNVSPLKFKSDYLGEFIEEGSYVFGDITNCVGELSDSLPTYAGIDWSVGKDNDYTVITYMDKRGFVTEIESFKDFTPTQLVDKLSESINAHTNLKCVQVETNSIGDVYMDFLKKRVRSGIIRGFTTTNDSKRKIIEQLITAFQNGKVRVPNEPELLKELQHYNIEKTPTGKVTYNGADGVHDDFVLSLAFAYDAYKRGMGAFSISFV